MDECEPHVEDFLRETPRLEATPDWFASWCRINNGGDVPYCTGPFKDDQLYVNSSELIAANTIAGMESYSTEGMDPNQTFYLTLWGALLAFKRSDPNDPGWMFDGKWQRLGVERKIEEKSPRAGIPALPAFEILEEDIEDEGEFEDE